MIYLSTGHKLCLLIKPKIGRSVLIIQTTTVPATEAVLILCMQRPNVSTDMLSPKINTAGPIVKQILRVDSLKISTAGRKNSTSALATLAAFSISGLLFLILASLISIGHVTESLPNVPFCDLI